MNRSMLCAVLGLALFALPAWNVATSADQIGPADEQAPASDGRGDMLSVVPAEQASDVRGRHESLREWRATGWGLTFQGECLTGNWGGVRDGLVEKGFEIGLEYQHVWQVNARGGLDTRHGQRTSGSWDIVLDVDTEKAGLWQNGRFWLGAKGSFGEGVNPKKVGALLEVNGDAEGNEVLIFSEYWYEHDFGDGALVVRIGKMDPAADFDTNALANDEVTQFLNAALVNNPQIPFPEEGLGVQAIWTPAPWLYGAAGIFDAEADARTTGFNTAMHGPARFFLVGEVGLTPTFEWGGKSYPGAYRVGCWMDPLEKETFQTFGRDAEPRLRSDDWGFYLSFDQLVWKEDEAGPAEGEEGEEGEQEQGPQGLGLFFRYGHARADVNEIENYYSWGVSYRGLLPGRDDDVFGAGFAYADLSDDVKKLERGRQREAAIELYYNIHVTDCISVTPDLQIIVDPGGDDTKDAVVAGVRLVIHL